MRTNAIRVLLVLSLAGLFNSCNRAPSTPEVTGDQFAVKDFQPMVNWNQGETLLLDYTDAIANGFFIPTERQTESGFFEFRFRVRNTGQAPAEFAYKVYYQNESYKFPEQDAGDSTRQHPNAWENFYGSWEETSPGFLTTAAVTADGEYHAVEGKFRIAGNPRNEPRYFTEGRNDRWKRNPRVGDYRFMLVVTMAENLRNGVIPEPVSDIGKPGADGFVNPFFWFLYGPGSRLANTIVQVSPVLLKVVARPDPGSGIYINPVAFSKEEAEKWKTDGCGQGPEIWKNAAFEQCIHYVDPSTKMNNIPVIEDVLGGGYSRMDYNWNRRFYRKEELIAITAAVAPRPCETVWSYPEGHKITLRNPDSEFGKWQKQNVGVITRHGMTFGKYTVKCKLSELLNRNNMWNGLTNAIWLITQDQAEWNYRRDCSTNGYMANYYGGHQDQRVKNVGYSEIDFEILKTVPYCPSWTLPPAYFNGVDDQYNVNNWNVPFPEEILADDDKVMVSCTNWDMACWQPAEFHDGCYPVHYEGKTFWAHRWDKNYRALTQKTPERDDELFGSPYYYFQIDWQPDRIIWRIGPSKDKLRVVGYQDDKVTSIPNNQMLLIVTQEFHNTKWWVGSAYSQDNIPFPAVDYTGEIYELTIE